MVEGLYTMVCMNGLWYVFVGCLILKMKWLMINAQGPLELFVTVTDSDFGEDDRIDDFIILFSDQLRADSVFSPTITQTGACGRATLSVRIRITSLCPANRYGPSCDIVCVDQSVQTNCNYLGEQQCLNGNFAPPSCDECNRGFQLPTCVTCAQDYYPQNSCDVFCQPRDDSGGRFTCDPVTGDRVCLPGYENPTTNCLDRTQGIVLFYNVRYNDIYICM